MIGYPFINDLFQSVLNKSAAIQGRFYISEGDNGRELNSDMLGQVLSDVLINQHSKKYPLALMMLPRVHSKFVDLKPDWQMMSITMFFLKTTFYDSSNQTSARNPNTNTSQHQVHQDWHDMARVAVNFLRALDKIQKPHKTNVPNLMQYFKMPHMDKSYYPVSSIGADRASGVRLDFMVETFVDCTLEDYVLSDLMSITIPTLDSHPQHNL